MTAEIECDATILQFFIQRYYGILESFDESFDAIAAPCGALFKFGSGK